MVFLPYSIALLVSALFSVCLAVYGWKRKDIKGAMAYGWLMLANAIYSTAYAFELASSSADQMMGWIRIEYLGMVFLGPLWLTMITGFVGKNEHVSKWTKAALFIIPVVTIVVVFTNDLHHLHYASISTDTSGLFPIFHGEKGPWYFVHHAYIGFCFVLSSILLFRNFRREATIDQSATLLMFATSLLTWLAGLVTISGYSPEHLDLTPFANILTGPLFLIGLIRFNVLNLIPAARGMIFDNMSDGVLIMNSQATIIDANSAALSMLGLQHQQVIGQSFHSINDLAQTAIETGLDVNTGTALIAFPAAHPGDEARRLELQQSIIFDVEGEPSGSIVILRDITARALAEEALVESERLYRTLIENMLDLVWITDRNMRITYLSPTNGRNWGYQLEDVLGHQVWDFLTPESQQIGYRAVSEFESSVAAGEIPQQKTIEVEQYCKDGSTIHIEITFRPISDEDGTLVGYQGLSRDITQRKHAEEELKQSYDRLAHLATHDPLTDLANRALCEDCLVEALDKAKTAPARLALLMIDLDNFKTVNDTYGHAAGDDVLKVIAQRMQSAVRKGDTVFRLAGDEFVVILEGVNTVGEARQVAEKLLQEVTKPIKLNGHVVQVGGSIGIALYPDHGQSPTELVQQADRAMYIAKKNATRISALQEITYTATNF
jgi:diguanylate cyclase (GGDEF)-like protein/PAS domain S-box-containing protein